MDIHGFTCTDEEINPRSRCQCQGDFPPDQRPIGRGASRTGEGRELWGGSRWRVTRHERGLESAWRGLPCVEYMCTKGNPKGTGAKN